MKEVIGKPLSRRDFLKYTGIAAVSLSFSDKIKSLELLKNVNSQSFVGVCNGHFLSDDIFSPNTIIRFPLNSRAFDESILPDDYPEKIKDPFYLKGEKLNEFRDKGFNFMMVIEMSPCDSNEHLEEMFNYANDFLDFRKGDKIQLGNEHNDKRKYPTEKYFTQSYFLHNVIKSVNEDIEVGFSAEAHNCGIEYFQELMEKYSKNSFVPFDYVPLNYYGRPQDMGIWVNSHRDIMHNFGIDLKIIISELGIRISENPFSEISNYKGEIIATPKQQVDALWKYFCFAKLLKCDNALWFCAQDELVDDKMERYGLSDENGNVRPGLNELLRVQKLIDETKQIKYKKEEDLYIFNLVGNNFETEISWTCSESDQLGSIVKIEQKRK